MVRVAIAIGSTSARSSHQRSTARTIFITSTGSAVAVALAHGHASCGGRCGGVDCLDWVLTTSVVVSVIALSSRAIRCRGREEGTTTQPAPPDEAGARRLRMPCDPPSRPRLTAHGVCGRWQVFGLADLRAGAWVLVSRRLGSYWPSLPTRVLRAVLDDGGRFRLPLRGSPGFSPGSLLPRRPIARPPDQQETPYAGGGCKLLAPHVGSACRVPRIAVMRRTTPCLRRGRTPHALVLAGCSTPPPAAWPRRRPAPRHTHGCRRPARGRRSTGKPPAVTVAQLNRIVAGLDLPLWQAGRHRRQRAAARRPDRLGLRRHRPRCRHHPAHRRELDARDQRSLHVPGRDDRPRAR